MTINQSLWLKSFIALLLILCNVISYANGHSKTLTLEVNKGSLLRYHSQPKTIFIADPTIADFQIKSPGLLYITGKKIGATNLYLIGENNETLLSRKILVKYNLSDIKTAIDRVLPRNHIIVETANNAIILRGSVDNGDQANDALKIAKEYASNVLNFMRVKKPSQVYLKVRVVEISKNIDNNLGITWQAFYNSNRASVLFPFPNTGTLSAITGATNGFSISSILNILEQNGYARILSEPNLTTLSGQTASFQAGGEFPILISQGLGTVSVDYRNFGVSLSFTPTIVGDDLINLQVAPEVSEISDRGAIQLENTFIPALTTRKANTTVELHSGQSFAIAGLLQNNITEIVNKVPGLGDIPILGLLFRSKTFKNNQTELVIIVTPYIVKPTKPNQLAEPGTKPTYTTGANTIKNKSQLPPPPMGKNTERKTGFML